MIVCLRCGVLLCWMMLLNQTLAMAADKSSCRPDVFVLVALFAGKTKTHTHRKKTNNTNNRPSKIMEIGAPSSFTSALSGPPPWAKLFLLLSAMRAHVNEIHRID